MDRRALQLPVELAGVTLCLSVSGGKDSTAAGLALIDAGLPFIAIHAETAWESSVTDEYLELLETDVLGSLVRVGKPGGMPEQMRRGRAPSRRARWCTRELKIDPIQAHHEQLIEQGHDVCVVVGIRHEEGTSSNGRADAKELEWSGDWDCWVWRPIVRWTIADVIAIHRRHGVPLNPLYEMGADRVGCWPCIYSNKEELRLIARIDPARIDLIRELEAAGSRWRRERNQETPGRYEHEDMTYFQSQRHGRLGIDEEIAWARTSRGGVQAYLFDPPPRGGCMRWGICDLPETTNAPGTEPEGA